MNPSEPLILAMDIGGTKIAAALVDETGQVHNRQELRTLAHQGRDVILSRVEALARLVLAGAPPGSVRAIGIASAGQIEPTGRVVYYATDNLPGWKGLNLAGTMENAFALPTVVDNDVNAMGLAEYHHGAGRGCDNLLCAMVGTGIGGALVLNGRLYVGAYGGAIELGHTPIQAVGGRPCNCGGVGCVETYASSRAIVHDFIDACPPGEIEAQFGKPPDQLTIQDIAAAFRQANPQDGRAVYQVVAQAAEMLGAGLAVAANLLDPRLIVLAGSTQLMGQAYLSLVRDSFVRRSMIPRQGTPIRFSELGADPSLIGAASLARQRFGG